MKTSLIRGLMKAARLTQGGHLLRATRVIGQAVASANASSAKAAHKLAKASRRGDVIDVAAWVVPDPPATAQTPGPPKPEPEARAAPAQFVGGSFSNHAGQRDYKLYIPAARSGASRRLIVMLHGCTQNPDDFANGTRMNRLAAEAGDLVLYPAQARSANRQGCWNWFNESDQRRDQGEPSIIADMTRQVIATHAIDPRQVFVAGLSAGGAMAVTLAAVYPELFAAAGVHSGLPHGVAHDVMSALSAMRSGPPRTRHAAEPPVAVLAVPTIVFHGDRDSTVHPCNGDEVVKRAMVLAERQPRRDQTERKQVEQGQVNGGHSWTRTIYRSPTGTVDCEHWLVHGGGHAWFGGDTTGSHTDVRGPDASAQMLRFFTAHAR